MNINRFAQLTYDGTQQYEIQANTRKIKSLF
jgi:hypothetical protein